MVHPMFCSYIAGMFIGVNFFFYFFNVWVYVIDIAVFYFFPQNAFFS
jgi:hypothetical protein